MTKPAKKSPSAAATARAREVTADPRWASVVGRDAAADGRFFYSVETTGVFCRPSCAARAPRPENVAFHESFAAAERAGFRACKRCKPGQPSLGEQYASQVAELCRFIQNAEHAPSLRALAERAGMSPYHLHRVFKNVTGLTPRAYAASRRAERVRTELGRGQSVTAAIYAAGFNSNGHFYAGSDHALGMTPSRYRNGGHEMQIRFAIGQCSLGAILVAATERGVCAILLGDDPDQLAADLERRFPRAKLGPGDAEFELLVARVVGLVEAPRVGLELPLDLRGTAFQERVWRALQNIPAGKTASYTDIAAHIGAPAAVRAVAHACAQNPVAVAIPCHRVVRVDGGLAGYRWGVARKRELLQREAEPC
jgi:AraC family transcriptional regulator, regulatory protein of adaptative response / methylated-DNA-[protein]-cysteine methyltransferase